MTETLSSRNSINTPKNNVVFSHTVKSGETISSILHSQNKINGYTIERIKGNNFLENLKAGDKIEFIDKWGFYHVTINGNTYLRKDNEPVRFFKNAQARELAKIDDAKRKETQEKTRKATEELKKEAELGAKYGFGVRKSTESDTYVITSAGNKSHNVLYMNFKTLQDTEYALKMLSSTKKIYNKNFTGKNRPKFYVGNNSINVDNRKFPFLGNETAGGEALDTTYISYQYFKPLIKPDQNTRQEMQHVVNFLNKDLGLE